MSHRPAGWQGRRHRAGCSRGDGPNRTAGVCAEQSGAGSSTAGKQPWHGQSQHIRRDCNAGGGGAAGYCTDDQAPQVIDGGGSVHSQWLAGPPGVLLHHNVGRSLRVWGKVRKGRPHREEGGCLGGKAGKQKCRGPVGVWTGHMEQFSQAAAHVSHTADERCAPWPWKAGSRRGPPSRPQRQPWLPRAAGRSRPGLQTLCIGRAGGWRGEPSSKKSQQRGGRCRQGRWKVGPQRRLARLGKRPNSHSHLAPAPRPNSLRHLLRHGHVQAHPVGEVGNEADCRPGHPCGCRKEGRHRRLYCCRC